MGKIGGHFGISGGFDKSAYRAKNMGMFSMQIFSKNQKQWKGKDIEQKKALDFHKAIEETKIITVVHSSYLINIGNPDKEKRNKSINAFIDEIKRCDILKVPYFVFHPGSHLGSGEKIAIDNIAESLNIIMEKYSPNVKILLETTAGQGTNIGYKFEHLRDIISLTKYSDKLGICVDTCHIYSAGYDIKNNWDIIKKEMDKILGLKNIFVFHLNDSKVPYASKKDRHENIGKGTIGKEALKRIYNDRDFLNIPFILETPLGEEGYLDDLKSLEII